MRLLASGIWALAAPATAAALPSSETASSSGRNSAAAVAALPQERGLLPKGPVSPQAGDAFKVAASFHNRQTVAAHSRKASHLDDHHCHCNNSTPDPSPLLPFCDNSMPMTMFMDGFRSSLFALEAESSEDEDEEDQDRDSGAPPPPPPPPCLQYLWARFKLSSRLRFGWAVIASFTLAVALEALSALRRRVLLAPHRSVRWPRPLVRSAATIHYAVQALLGYLLMLAVMTYSAELLMAVLLGLVAGHAAFAAESLPSSSGGPIAVAAVPPCGADGGARISRHRHYRQDFSSLSQPLLGESTSSSLESYVV